MAVQSHGQDRSTPRTGKTDASFCLARCTTTCRQDRSEQRTARCGLPRVLLYASGWRVLVDLIDYGSTDSPSTNHFQATRGTVLLCCQCPSSNHLVFYVCIHHLQHTKEPAQGDDRRPSSHRPSTGLPRSSPPTTDSLPANTPGTTTYAHHCLLTRRSMAPSHVSATHPPVTLAHCYGPPIRSVRCLPS
jgi:hypothetical protein